MLRWTRILARLCVVMWEWECGCIVHICLLAIPLFILLEAKSTEMRLSHCPHLFVGNGLWSAVGIVQTLLYSHVLCLFTLATYRRALHQSSNWKISNAFPQARTSLQELTRSIHKDPPPSSRIEVSSLRDAP